MSFLILFLCLFIGANGQGKSEVNSGEDEFVIAYCYPIGTTVQAALGSFVGVAGISAEWIQSATILTQSYTQSVGDTAVYVQVDRTQTFHFIQTTSSATRVEVHFRFLPSENVIVIMDSAHSVMSTAAKKVACTSMPENDKDPYLILDHKETSSWWGASRYADDLTENDVASILSDAEDPQGVLSSSSSDTQLSAITEEERTIRTEKSWAAQLFDGDLQYVCKKPIVLWTFMLYLLADQKYNEIITWSSSTKGEFILKERNVVSFLWGLCKRKTAMNYENLARSLRNYYKSKIMQKSKTKYAYQFHKNTQSLTGYTEDELKRIHRGYNFLYKQFNPSGFNALIRRNLEAINLNLNRISQTHHRSDPTVLQTFVRTNNAIANTDGSTGISLAQLRTNLKMLQERVANLEYGFKNIDSQNGFSHHRDELRKRHIQHKKQHFHRILNSNPMHEFPIISNSTFG